MPPLRANKYRLFTGDGRAQAGWMALLAVSLSGPSLGQTVTFFRPTDSIAFPTACLPNQMAETVEVRFKIPGPQTGGQFYGEHQAFFFDRQLGMSTTGVYEYSHPIDSGEVWSTPVAITPGDWHHLAFCYDGTTEFMYYDGALLASRPRTGAIAPGCGGGPIGGVAALGWLRRTDGAEYAAAAMTIDWFRVSSVVRYTGATYTPATEPIAPDAGTSLLYSFDECEASSTVQDLGPLHRNGELGGNGGTSPTLTSPVYANCDRSSTPPVLNINDFLCFQSRFVVGDPYANCDGSTTPPVLNINDFICFQARFLQGC